MSARRPAAASAADIARREGIDLGDLSAYRRCDRRSRRGRGHGPTVFSGGVVPARRSSSRCQDLSERHRRSSIGLTVWLRSIAVELGGRPAARLCRRLRLIAGRTRLLRLLTAPTVPDRAPRVLGVDEFVFREGCTYGTVLVDVEAGRVVDVLPDRTSETLAAWLTEHPGAEIICRDRASAYT
ncbi:hypothetical protein GT039_34010 [Streptomyces sp. SID2955]|nr:hypothetical protein [Streptomyces sp. SID2955]